LAAWAALLAERLRLSDQSKIILRLCRRGLASNIELPTGKPEAFRKERGKAAK
jgi:hypothetical protein